MEKIISTNSFQSGCWQNTSILTSSFKVRYFTSTCSWSSFFRKEFLHIKRQVKSPCYSSIRNLTSIPIMSPDRLCYSSSSIRSLTSIPIMSPDRLWMKCAIMINESQEVLPRIKLMCYNFVPSMELSNSTADRWV